MRLLRLIFFLLPGSLIAAAPLSEGKPAPDFHVTGPGATTLRAWRDRARVVIVFAPRKAGPESEATKWTQQQKNFGESGVPAAFADRDLVVVVVSDGTGSWAPGLKLARPVDGTAAAVRLAYGVGNEQFLALLVGKDGDIKKVSSEAFRAAELFAIIDSMPMRRQEMK